MRSLITDVTKGFLRVYIATRQQIAQNKDALPLPTPPCPLPNLSLLSLRPNWLQLVFDSPFFVSDLFIC